MMQTFQVGFYKDVFKNGAYNFEECDKMETFDVEGAAYMFAFDAYNNLDMSQYGCDEDYWDEESHSIVVKDTDGNIYRFSVCVDTELVFGFDEIAI